MLNFYYQWNNNPIKTIMIKELQINRKSVRTHTHTQILYSRSRCEMIMNTSAFFKEHPVERHMEKK